LSKTLETFNSVDEIATCISAKGIGEPRGFVAPIVAALHGTRDGTWLKTVRTNLHELQYDTVRYDMVLLVGRSMKSWKVNLCKLIT
jgi:hypothetical protein